MTDLQTAFLEENLQRAWLWTRTNSNREYKQYFRHIYNAYSIAAPDAIKDLRRRLSNGSYDPSFATKLYFPKKSGILRPYSLLSMEDQIVYQALINVVAEKLFRHVNNRYLVSVFGNLYAGKTSMYFYQDWHRGYGAFSDAIRDTVGRGFIFAASFDLTACYDSIDHKVLSHFLSRVELEPEFSDFLQRCLSRWTVAQNESPIYIGHGIPQGPLPSGLLSEVVLRHFDDDKRNTRQIAYFRYVDDIRLFSKSEESLRQHLVRLDMRSKEIGLFPQSSKIEIHAVRNVDDEIKGISHPPEWDATAIDPDHQAIRDRIIALTPHYKVTNETRFKFVLGRAAPHSGLSKRLLKIIEKQPHLFRSIFGYLSRSSRLSAVVSARCLNTLASHALYPAFTAALIRSIRDNLHPRFKSRFYNYCRSRLSGKLSTRDPELRAAAVSVLLINGKLTWNATRYNLFRQSSWWLRSELIRFLNPSVIGTPSYETLLNILLRDTSPDVAVVSADTIIAAKLRVTRPIRDIAKTAQYALRSAGIIGRVSEGVCLVSRYMIGTLGQRVSAIRWRRICSDSYDDLLAKVVRWSAYAQTDATAWVNLTDTINDLVLDLLFAHDPSIGARALGQFGPVIPPTSRFAVKYPAFHQAVVLVHIRRLESDLSHAVTSATGKRTRKIRFRELSGMKSALARGYLEIWRLW